MVDEERGLKAEYRGNCTPSRVALPLVSQIRNCALVQGFPSNGGALANADFNNSQAQDI
jgi:hypothetical protein